MSTWRGAIETYARFVASDDDPTTRIRNWKEGEPAFITDRVAKQIANDGDALTPEIINVAVRIETEIALITCPKFSIAGVQRAVERLLQRPLAMELVEPTLTAAIAKMERAEADLLRRAHSTKRSVDLNYPRLVEKDEVAAVLRLTQARKIAIFGRGLKIEAVDKPKPAKPLSEEKKRVLREDRKLAERYGVTPPTVRRHRAAGPAAFLIWRERKEKALAIGCALPDGDGLHPVERGEQALKAAARREKRRTKADRPAGGKSAQVRRVAERAGVSESTVYRRLARGQSLSEIESQHVRTLVELAPDFVRFDDHGRFLLSFEIGRSERLDPAVKLKLKETRALQTGRTVSDSALYQWKKRKPQDYAAAVAQAMADLYDERHGFEEGAVQTESGKKAEDVRTPGDGDLPF